MYKVAVLKQEIRESDANRRASLNLNLNDAAAIQSEASTESVEPEFVRTIFKQFENNKYHFDNLIRNSYFDVR